MKYIFIPLTSIIIIISLCTNTVHGQDIILHQLRFHAGQQEQPKGNYQEVKENNLPIKGTQAIYQSSDQTIWIGTKSDGLIAYSGNFIKHYRHDAKDSASLSDNKISDIWEESPTILWLTTRTGIDKLNRITGKFTHIQNGFGVGKGRDGKLYSGSTGQGLQLIDTINKRLQRVPDQEIYTEGGKKYSDEAMEYMDFKFDKRGILWAVGKTKTLAGLFNFNAINNHWIFHALPAYYNSSFYDKTIKKVTRPLNIFMLTISFDDNQNVWCGGLGTGLFCYDTKTGKWQQYLFYNAAGHKDVSLNFISSIYLRSKNRLWLGTIVNGFELNVQEQTIYDYRSQNKQGITPNADVSPFTLVDHCGNSWITTQEGVYKYNLKLQNFPFVSKILSKNQLVTSFYQISPKHYLLGTLTTDSNNPTHKKYILEIKKGVIIKSIPLNNPEYLTEFIPIDNNEFYVCGNHLYKLNLQTSKIQTLRIKIKNESPGSSEYFGFSHNILWNDSILYTCKGNLLEITGLVKINLKTKEGRLYKTNSTILSPKLPQDDMISNIMKDSYNRIWCSELNGFDIFYPQTENFEHYYPGNDDTTLGQSSQGTFFCESPDHTFYVASLAGVFATKAIPGTRATFNPVTSMPCSDAWITGDKNGALWTSISQGVARIDPATKTYKSFGSLEGFYWKSYFKPFVTKEGYFVMHDGAIIDPTNIAMNDFKPIPKAADFQVAGQPFSMDTAIEFKKHIFLKNSQNFFNISYTSNSYIDEAHNSYRYQLQDVDKDWVDAGQRTIAYYTALPPGIYQFYLQAANNDGVWGDPKKLLTITIVPAWYQTWWFKGGIALLFVIVIYGFYHQRIKEEKLKGVAKEQKAELKQIKAEFEKQIAETEMAALRAQMNPHFIFNVLNSINKYILSNDKSIASDYLVQFSRLIRLTLENSKAAKVPLQNDLEALRIYICMEKLRFGNQFSFTIEVNEKIDQQFTQIPPLLIQPYVENAIWHGLMQKDDPGYLSIKITESKDSMIKVVVVDNGVGRKLSAELKSKSATINKSYGMQITSDRIKIVNNLYNMNTTVEVEDLYDRNNQSIGTKVTLSIPV